MRLDRHPARRPRGPAAGALVRRRLQGAAQRSAARARADLRVRRRSRPSDEVTRPLRALRDELAVSDGDGAGEVPAELRRAAAADREARGALAGAARPADRARRAAPSGRRRRTRRCAASTRRASRSSSTSSAARCSSRPTRPGKLICARYDGGQLNTHFRDFARPMGLAVAPGRIAIGTRAEVLDYRELPGRRAEGRAAGQARRLLPAAQQALHRRHPDPRDRLRPGRALDRRHQLLLPGDPRRRAQLRPALEAALHLRARPPRTAAT